jgi:hypothetical protein
MAAGRLPFVRVGGIYLFETAELDAWNARRKAGEFGTASRKRKVAKA